MTSPDSEASDPEGLDEQDIETLEEPDPNPSGVSYKGTDFDVKGLCAASTEATLWYLRSGIQEINPSRQHAFSGFCVDPSADGPFYRVPSSGISIPGIFLVRQADKRYLVLDGQQRLSTLAAFYAGIHDKREFALHNVANDFKALTYETLPAELRRTLDSTFIQATIVETDGSTESLDAVYQVFERLNSGGRSSLLTRYGLPFMLVPSSSFLPPLMTIPRGGSYTVVGRPGYATRKWSCGSSHLCVARYL